MSPRLQNNRGRAGFTLFELVIAITLMTFIVAMVFELLVSFLSATSFLQAEQKRLDQVGALRAYLQRTFAAVPSEHCVMSTAPGASNSGLMLGNEEGFTVFDSVIQNDGLINFGMTNIEMPNDPSWVNWAKIRGVSSYLSLVDWPNTIKLYESFKHGLRFTPLITDLKDFHWRFYDRNDQKWCDFWTYTDRNPRVIECSFQFAGDSDTTTFDFFPMQLTQQPVFTNLASNLPQGATPQPGGNLQATPNSSPAQATAPESTH